MAAAPAGTGGRMAGGRRGRSRGVDPAPDRRRPGRARPRPADGQGQEHRPARHRPRRLPPGRAGPQARRRGRRPAERTGLHAHQRARGRRYSDDDLTLLYWGIGLHLGQPWAQNKHGHVLGDVTDQGKTIADPTVRGNELGGIALDYHTDGSDLVGLLCLRTARTGRPVLRGQRRGHPQPDGRASTPSWPPPSTTSCPRTRGASRPTGLVPTTPSRGSPSTAGRLFVRFIPQYILASQRHPDAPRLERHAPGPPSPGCPSWPTTRTSTSTWTCSPARCSSSTTTTCCTAARPTRTTTPTATSATSSASGWPPTP